MIGINRIQYYFAKKYIHCKSTVCIMQCLLLSKPIPNSADGMGHITKTSYAQTPLLACVESADTPLYLEVHLCMVMSCSWYWAKAFPNTRTINIVHLTQQQQVQLLMSLDMTWFGRVFKAELYWSTQSRGTTDAGFFPTY